MSSKRPRHARPDSDGDRPVPGTISPEALLFSALFDGDPS